MSAGPTSVVLVSTATDVGGRPSRQARAGRLGVLFAAVWLVFLADSFREGWRIAWSGDDELRGWVGMLATVAFAASYLALFEWVRRHRLRMDLRVPLGSAVAMIVGLLALMMVMVVALGQEGTAAAVFVAVAGVMCLPALGALALTAALAVGVEVASHTVSGWSDPAGLSFAVCAAAFAVWGVTQLMARNIDLVHAEEENARLAVAEERNRFARDLHDILGHSLTVITVKAELANRLLDADPSRVRAELDDLERLSRDALADVRRAVEGYRDLTLPGELARARAALRAAEIEADLPNSTDDVPSELRELFAWTVREGVTNVIRHSGAARCTVRFGPTGVEVCDDGSGPVGDTQAGNGLTGLRERASAAGAVLVTSAVEPQGFRLAVRAR